MKSKKLYILACGLSIALVQFLGIPGTWKSAVAVVLGLTVAVLTFLLKREEVRGEGHRARSGDAYAENSPTEAAGEQS